MNSELFLILGAAGYLLASVFYCEFLLKAQPGNQESFLLMGRIAGTFGILCQTAAIGLHCMHTHNTPISTGPEAVSATGWAVAILYFVIEAVNWKKPPSAIGAFAFPIAFLSVFTGTTLGARTTHLTSKRIHLLDSSLVGLHIMAVVFAFGLLTLAVCCSVVYLVEHRMLKRKKILGGIFAKLPPLATVDHMAFTLVCLAFPLLSLGIIAGIIRAASTGTPLVLWFEDAHTLSSVVCWGVYALYLWAHATSNWQGLRANYLLLAGLAAGILCYFAPSTLHHFT